METRLVTRLAMMTRLPFFTVVFLFGFLQIALAVTVSIWEPFPDLFDYDEEGNLPQPFSPDPLLRYTWSQWHDDRAQLQVYRVNSVTAYNATGSISGAESLYTNQTNLFIFGNGQLILDFGVERAAWLEFESPDLNGCVQAAISEFNAPQKTRSVTKYGNTYRLETNQELYEGIRFAWLYFENVTRPWHITKLTLVSKIKPINYTGFFEAFDTALTEAWYTGAYAVRLNMEADSFNSVLVERGDRVSIQGDVRIYSFHTMDVKSVGCFAAVTYMFLFNTTGPSNHGSGIGGIFSLPACEGRARPNQQWRHSWPQCCGPKYYGIPHLLDYECKRLVSIFRKYWGVFRASAR